MAEKRPLGEDDQGAKVKRRRFGASTNIITVIVGKAKEKFLLHDEVLSQCAFFAKCLASGMREQDEKIIHLPEDDPDGFDFLIRWLYAECLDTRPLPPSWDVGVPDLLKAYNMAHKFCMPELQNAIIDLFRPKAADFKMSPKLLLWVCQNTPDGCKLQDLVQDQLYHDVVRSPQKYSVDVAGKRAPVTTTPDFGLELEQVMEEDRAFGVTLMWRILGHVRLLRGPGGSRQRPFIPDPSQLSGCHYHVHDNGSVCRETNKP